MTIEFIGKFNFDQLHKLAQYIRQNEVNIWTMTKPIYVFDAKIERPQKHKILITT